MTEESKSKSKRPDFEVLAKTSKSDGSNGLISIGVGFYHKDKVGINVLLDCLPNPIKERPSWFFKIKDKAE
ncbi:MAG: hypothetical protein IPP42_17610 [Saprospiraceae bacterium]|nr:hypothetical protein [Saprospiraceae bacterium]